MSVTVFPKATLSGDFLSLWEGHHDTLDRGDKDPVATALTPYTAENHALRYDFVGAFAGGATDYEDVFDSFTVAAGEIWSCRINMGAEFFINPSDNLNLRITAPAGVRVLGIYLAQYTVDSGDPGETGPIACGRIDVENTVVSYNVSNGSSDSSSFFDDKGPMARFVIISELGGEVTFEYHSDGASSWQAHQSAMTAWRLRG